MELYLIGSIIGLILTVIIVVHDSEGTLTDLVRYMSESDDETWFDYFGYALVIFILSWLWVAFLILERYLNIYNKD